ncbi:hypothetical protein ABPG73_002950 [Tetrahymena malaccensis]
MKQISKSCLISGIFIFLLIKSNLCQPTIYDSNLGIYQCENKSLVINQYLCSPYNNCQNSQFYSLFNSNCMIYCEKGVIAKDEASCSSSQICIDGYQWSSNNLCEKQQKCNQGIINSDLNLYQCLDCSLVIDIRFCNLNCQNLQFYSQSTSKCMTYCGNGFIEYMNCNSNYNLCIDGFIFSKDDNKCIKVKSCQQQIFDKSLNLFLCSNCGLASDIVYCFKGCSAGYFSQTQGCMQYCRNGLIAKDQFSCQTSNNCIDGFQWSQQDSICKKCNYSLIDKDFNLYQCPNCSITSNIKLCSNFCGKFQYYSKQNQCLLYCGNGELSNVADQCLSNFKFCVDGFFKSNLDNKCKRCGDQSTFDSYFNLYTCLNCSFVSNIQDCKNSCQQSEYFSQSLGCRYYCGNGLITYGGQQNCNSATNSCIDGFYFNYQTGKCQKSCVQNIFDSRLNIYQCSNCSLVTNTQYCSNTMNCQNQYFYNINSNKCMFYCGNGLIAQDQASCNNSSTCVDGLWLSIDDNKCKKCDGYILDANLNLFLCQNCGLTTDTKLCVCGSSFYYSLLISKCMAYCGNGLISVNQQSCQTSNICIDGLQWNSQSNKCEACISGVFDEILNIYRCKNCILVTNLDFCQKSCINSQYYSQQYGCMVYCGKGLLAQSQDSCQNTNICIDGFQFNQQEQKCLKCKQTDFVDNIKMYQCENCSLVTDIQFCQNSCSANQFYSQQKKICMYYCGNGVVANDLSQCFSLSSCVDEFYWNPSTNQCEKQQICKQTVIDQSLNLYQCQNCSFVSNIQFCSNSCQNFQYYSWLLDQCMAYCGNGQLAQIQTACQFTNICIDGFQWNLTSNKCEKQQTCNQNIFDQNFNIYQCTNCSLVADIQLCQNSCSNLLFYSQDKGECMTYCGKGLVLNQSQADCLSANICIDKYQFNQQSKQCTYKQTCPLYTDNYIKYCNDCGVVTLTQSCQNSCSNNQYYSQQYKQCMYYCGSGLIAKDKNSCSLTLQCVDGLQLKTYQKCENIQQTACPYTTLPDSFVKICSNCSLVSDKNQCNFCGSFQYYFSKLQKCMFYCGDGLIASCQACCQQPEYCVEGYQLDTSTKQCVQTNCPATTQPDAFIKVCTNCSLVADIKFCQNTCVNINKSYYFLQQDLCMFYCGNGLISQNEDSCKSTTICVDGFQWNSSTKKCEQQQQQNTCPVTTVPDNYVSVCNNCSFVNDTKFCSINCFILQKSFYYSVQQNQCVFYCGKGLIAQFQANCQSTNICIDGFQWNSSNQKCEKQQQIVCEERIVESTLKLYQCPNCSLVTNTQFCKNSCAVSQVYSYANCMVHCGNGLIAKDQMSCQSSNLCIEGFIFTSQGICNPKDSKINQEMDQNFILINILIPLFLVFFIVIFLCWVVKKLKFVSQTQAKDQELQKQQYEEAKIKILKHQQEIDYLKQKENIKPQNELNQNQIILNINNENDIEEQSLSKQTVNMIENFNPYQQNIDSQQQFQQLPILENQESS